MRLGVRRCVREKEARITERERVGWEEESGEEEVVVQLVTKAKRDALKQQDKLATTVPLRLHISTITTTTAHLFSTLSLLPHCCFSRHTTWVERMEDSVVLTTVDSDTIDVDAAATLVIVCPSDASYVKMKDGQKESQQ